MMSTTLRFLLLAAAAAALPVSCHLALGIEDAETIAGTAGGGSGCSNDAQCDDANACTTDSCSGGSCANPAVPDGDAPAEQQTSGDCRRVVCSGGNAESSNDDADLPVDDEECTADLCSSGAPSNEALTGGTPCSQDGGSVCNGEGRCVECYSNQHCGSPNTCGGGGTPWSCGCTPDTTCLSEGLTCGSFGLDDCGNPSNCSNGIQDGTETDVDCGGTVGACSIRCNSGKNCNIDQDCASQSCPAGTCV